MIRGQLVVDASPARETRAHNPYNALLYDHLAELGVTVRPYSVRRLLLDPPDVVHIHWPELTLLSGRRWHHTLPRLAGLTIGVLLGRVRRGTVLVWTAHNVGAHEDDYPRAQAALVHWVFPRLVDGLLLLTPSAGPVIRSAHRLGRAAEAVTPHGHYRSEIDTTVTRRDARDHLGLPEHVTLLLFVGQVRPYKDVPALVDGFRAVPGTDLRLAVAGADRLPPGESDQLRADAAQDDRVVLDLQHLSPERLSWWLRAADAVVLPYSDVLNSGAALLALSADRPVVAPHLGALVDLQASAGQEWVHTYSGTIADALSSAVEFARAPRAGTPDLGAHDWPRVACATLDAFTYVRRGRRGA